MYHHPIYYSNENNERNEINEMAIEETVVTEIEIYNLKIYICIHIKRREKKSTEHSSLS